MLNAKYSRALIWSLIAAAFIGPGTITTAARAGAEGGYHYAPYVFLAAVAGFLLMEMAARLTLVSGRSLGQVLGEKQRWLAIACFVAVLLGCMAYQAGNLLGAISGIALLLPVGDWLVLPMGAGIAGLMWPGETRKIARALAGIVVVMGGMFTLYALTLLFGNSSLVGREEVDSRTVVGLIGTTIVPYNFFLAAGLSRGEKLADMRWGLFGSFVIGALITVSIVMVGSLGGYFNSFEDLARTLDAGVGQIGKPILAFGLFAAGFSSAVTAPLAAGLAGRELLSDGEDEDWAKKGKWFRIVWGGVLLMGVLVALLQLNIVSVILAAQVANGLLLPFIAAIVLVLANDRSLLGDKVNTWWQNLLGLAVATLLAYKNAHVFLGLLQLVNLLFVGLGLGAYLFAGGYLILVGWLIWRRR